MGARILVLGIGPLRERFFLAAAGMDLETTLVEESAYSRYDRMCTRAHAWRLWDHGRPGPDFGLLETFRGNVDGVVALNDWSVPIAADLAGRWGLPGAGAATVRRGHDKLAVRAALAAAGIDDVRHREVGGAADVESFFAALGGGPIVLKPKDGVASLGVRLAKSVEEAVAALPGVLAATGRDSVLAEEYLAGPEFSLEAVVRAGKVLALAVTEKTSSGAPYFIELGHVVGGDQYGTRRHRTAVGFLGRVVRALEVDDAIVHAEVKRAGDGWRLIELALRPAGGLIVDLVRDSHGVDLYEEQLRLALGLPPAELPAARSTGHAGVRFVAGSGTVADFPSMAPVRADVPDIRYAERLLAPGCTIPEVNANWWRAGYVYGVSDSRERLERQLDTSAARLLALLDLVPIGHRVDVES